MENLEESVVHKNIAALARMVTLNESTKIEDNILADKFIEQHQTRLNHSIVLSISGAPGVGKSSFIETLGVYLHSLGYSIAVFSIDPSSEKTHGSILGDKTRMVELGNLRRVFIRPSPSSNRLGGLGINTHKNIELAKIAGYEIILVETVGVGQSETIVKNLCDVFLLLLMPASGDELQGIKKGIMEVADFYVIHKADGELENVARISKKEIEIALHMTKSDEDLSNKIFSFSSMNKIGLGEIWTSISKHIDSKKTSNQFLANRKNQRIYWLEEEFNAQILNYFKRKHIGKLDELKSKIEKGNYIGVREILKAIE